MADTGLVVPLITAIAAVTGYLITARVGKSGSREVALINELQEELAKERDAREKLTARVDDLFNRIQILATVNTLWEIHSTHLEAQIISFGETPTPRPPALTRKPKEEN